MKFVPSALTCALLMAVATAVGAQTTVPTPIFNGLTFSGNSNLSFSADLLNALQSSSSATAGSTTVTSVSSIVPTYGTPSPTVPLNGLSLNLLPSTPGALVIDNTALQQFMDALKLAQTPPPAPLISTFQQVSQNITLPSSTVVDISSVPEPGSLALMILGLSGVIALGRAKRA